MNRYHQYNSHCIIVLFRKVFVFVNFSYSLTIESPVNATIYGPPGQLQRQRDYAVSVFYFYSRAGHGSLLAVAFGER